MTVRVTPSSRIDRLRRPQDFRRCFQGGRMYKNRLLVLHVLPNASPPQEASPPRVGYSVSRKLGKAVVRNRVKRRLREAVRREVDQLPAGCDLVFSARMPGSQASFQELWTAVQDLLRRASGRRHARAGKPLEGARRPPKDRPSRGWSREGEKG